MLYCRNSFGLTTISYKDEHTAVPRSAHKLVYYLTVLKIDNGK